MYITYFNLKESGSDSFVSGPAKREWEDIEDAEMYILECIDYINGSIEEMLLPMKIEIGKEIKGTSRDGVWDYTCKIESC